MSLPVTMLFMCVIAFLVEQLKVFYLSIQANNNLTLNS